MIRLNKSQLLTFVSTSAMPSNSRANTTALASLRMILFLAFFCTWGFVQGQARHYFQLKVYHLADSAQLQKLDSYLKDAYVPALHRNGVKQVGVFQTVESDTGGIRFYVFTAFRSLQQLSQIQKKIDGDKTYQSAGKDYINASWDQPPYQRIETIILDPFVAAPFVAKPKLTAKPKDRIYELRSYEGPTEKYYESKLKMFNVGNEISIFNNLNFNPVFYGSVLSGSRMPNLMYMTSFNSMADRDAHWKDFVDDALWKSLSNDPQYQHVITRMDIVFLHSTPYSDL